MARRRNRPRLGMRVFLAGKKGPSIGGLEALSVIRMGWSARSRMYRR
jgi:hypothetical protein